jgi:Ca2+-binding EF-hand superfamily protein
MKTHTTLTIAILSTLAIASFAPSNADAASDVSNMDSKANKHAARSEIMFKKLDTNGDGALTKDEVQSYPRLNQRFDTFDSNNDAKLTLAEIQAYTKGDGSPQAGNEKQGKPSPSAMFESLDQNKDNMLNREELKGNATLSAKFDDIDGNKDGGITQDEMHEFLKTLGKQMRAKNNVMIALDKNADGKLSRDEAGGNPKLSRIFDRSDANKDGLLTQEELHSYRKAVHDKARAAK